MFLQRVYSKFFVKAIKFNSINIDNIKIIIFSARSFLLINSKIIKQIRTANVWKKPSSQYLKL